MTLFCKPLSLGVVGYISFLWLKFWLIQWLLLWKTLTLELLYWKIKKMKNFILHLFHIYFCPFFVYKLLIWDITIPRIHYLPLLFNLLPYYWNLLLPNSELLLLLPNTGLISPVLKFWGKQQTHHNDYQFSHKVF